jgi:nicotinamide-nucleotide adenylyltransferase
MKAVFLGRFQPFHKGHYNVVEKYRGEYDDFSLVIGSAGAEETKDNPLSFEERKEVIQECFPELEIQKLEDEEKNKEGNRKWVTNLEDKTDAEKIISGNKLVQRLVSEYSEMNVQSPDMYDPEIYSGTEIRRRIRSGEEWRYLIPKESQERLEDLEEKIRDAGHDFSFKPGWKKENAYHETADDDR